MHVICAQVSVTELLQKDPLEQSEKKKPAMQAFIFLIG